LGGKVVSPDSTEFVDTDAVDVVGVFPNYATALDAWRDAAFATIDDAETRYFIVHLHRLLEPDEKLPDAAG
jgi:hypothetical protein